MCSFIFVLYWKTTHCLYLLIIIQPSINPLPPHLQPLKWYMLTSHLSLLSAQSKCITVFSVCWPWLTFNTIKSINNVFFLLKVFILDHNAGESGTFKRQNTSRQHCTVETFDLFSWFKIQDSWLLTIIHKLLNIKLSIKYQLIIPKNCVDGLL